VDKPSGKALDQGFVSRCQQRDSLKGRLNSTPPQGISAEVIRTLYRASGKFGKRQNPPIIPTYQLFTNTVSQNAFIYSKTDCI
jgi:hypothetical protein